MGKWFGQASEIEELRTENRRLKEQVATLEARLRAAYADAGITALADPSSPTASTDPLAPATASSASPEHPIIDVDGEKWLLTEPVTVIGRGSEADIVVNDSGVSRRHLELRITPTGVIATDLGSTNGSFVEGHRIDAATLLDGNQIVIGRTKILFWTHPDQSGV